MTPGGALTTLVSGIASSALVQGSDGDFYGTTSSGGTNNLGTVFRLTIEPQLAITRAGTNVILSWPTNAVGFTLECATNLDSPVVWNAVNGQYAVTNPIAGSRMFYRLARGQNFGSDWKALELAMVAAGGISDGHQEAVGGAGGTAYDMIYLPVPTHVVELANANPALCVVSISLTEGPAPGFGCMDSIGDWARWEGLVGPQSTGSRVIVFPDTPTVDSPCTGSAPAPGF
jgi:uncharacterized repeat protein (TIGR03803 family)